MKLIVYEIVYSQLSETVDRTLFSLNSRSSPHNYLHFDTLFTDYGGKKLYQIEWICTKKDINFNLTHTLTAV